MAENTSSNKNMCPCSKVEAAPQQVDAFPSDLASRYDWCGRTDMCPFWVETVEDIRASTGSFPWFSTTTVLPLSLTWMLSAHVLIPLQVPSTLLALFSPSDLVHWQNFRSGWTQWSDFSRWAVKQVGDGKNKIARLENLAPFWIHVLRPQRSTQDCSKLTALSS